MKNISNEIHINESMSILLTKRLLLILSIWEKNIVPFIERKSKLSTVTNPNGLRQLERTLHDMDTYIVATSLVLRQLQNGKRYSLNELASVLQPNSENSESLRNSAKQKIRETILPRVGNYYGLFEYTKPEDPWNGQHGYEIWASDILIAFFNEIVFPQLGASQNVPRKGIKFFYPEDDDYAYI